MNFDNMIVTRSKNKRKILYELNEDGELKETSNGITLKIKKKQKKTIDDESDSDYVPSEDDENSSEEESEDELVPMKEAWKDSLDIIEDDEPISKLDDTFSIIKDSLRDVIMDRVMKRLREDYEEEEDSDDEEDSEDEEDFMSKKKKVEYYKKDEYYKNMTKKEKAKIKKAEEEIKNFNKEIKPVELDVLTMDTTVANKSYMMSQLKMFRNMSPNDSEYEKMQKWVKGMSLIPFGKKIELPVTISDSNSKINKFMEKCYKILDNTIYGQTNAKNKMIQIIAQWISNPNSKTNVIALEGPPGVGKTSLVKEGVSEALHRPFVFLPVGGATDVSTFEGHSFTYTGATWGNIVQGLMSSQCMNPIFFFDELDKIGKTEKGDEVSGLLTHLTDPVQNDKFHDQFFGDIELNLNSAFFIFSYNHSRLINPILKDRMTVIKFDEYKPVDKVIIGQKYMLPKILGNIGLKKEDIIISDQVIKYIISNYAISEKGVRGLKRCLTEIVMKLNMMRFLKKNKNIKLPNNLQNIKVELPFNVSIELAEKLLKSNSFNKLPEYVRHMYS